jgi:plasmid stability protein
MARLKEIAREHGRSLESEARMALRQWLSQRTPDERSNARAEFTAWAARMRGELAGEWHGDSTTMVRDDRERG